MDQFRSIDEIPLPYRNIFTEYPCFNGVQSQVLDDILYTDNSVVVSAPTGSGKTAIFELAIIRLLIQYENIDVSQKIKIVYISPIKALCHERLTDWHNKFSPFGLNCVAATGDSENFDFQNLNNHNLIISTPEKWDSLTRRWREHEKIIRVIKLFMIDEVHLLNEENRGSTLEVIVCRMKTVENSISYSEEDNDIFSQRVRFVALSATVPNVEDIAQWIGNPSHTKHFRFSEEMRPVKLKKLVYGYSYNSKATSPFKFDMSLNYKLPSLMMQHSEEKPTLIFCSTRKSVEMAANHLLHSLKIKLNEEQTQKLAEVANLISDAKAKTTIRHGVGYHHAGMIPETRHAIESLFRGGDLPVLVTTSTLALGVNLPAHLVIIKSTKCYDAGGFRDYTETAIHQMMGRAGRPQFDTSATALILTTNEDKHKFEQMVGCSQPIESNLHRHLTEHLNAEIVLGTITDLDVAMQWLSSTFLYVRARKNPRHYGINASYTQEQMDKKLLEMCQIDLNKLVKTGMITIDENIAIIPNPTGKIMAKYYVAFETMKLFTQISGTEILMQILALISKCQEFVPMRLRVNDKKTLNLLNKNSNRSTIRFPLNGRIKTGEMKVNCIIQAVLGNLEIADYSIQTESLTIMRNGERIAKCLIAYLETRGSNCYGALLNAVVLAKCFRARLWENSAFVGKQLTGIGSVMSGQLANAGKTSFAKILEANPRDLELIIKRKPPMGSALVEEVQHIPRYKMTMEKSSDEKRLEICVSLENVEHVREKSTVNVHSTMVLLVGDSSNEILLYEKYAHSYMLEHSTIQRTLEIPTDSNKISVHFISEDWVGFDCEAKTETRESDGQKPNKNGGKTKTATPDKKGPAYIQMFLDMYMKIKKKATVPAKTTGSKEQEPLKNSAKTSSLGTGQASASINTVETDKESVETHKSPKDSRTSMSPNKSSAFEEGQSPVDTQEIDRLPVPPEDDLNISFQSLFSNEDREERRGKPSEDEKDKHIKKASAGDGNIISLVNIEKRVATAPSLLSIFKKYGADDSRSTGDCIPFEKSAVTTKRGADGDQQAMELKDSLHKEDARKRQSLEEFKFPSKKKFSHGSETEDVPDSTADRGYYGITEILEPIRQPEDAADRIESDMEDSSKERSKDNIQKNIKWRSPLIFSPAVKFSPKISFQNLPIPRDYSETEGHNESNNETFETSISSRSNLNLTLNIQRTPKHTQTSTTRRNNNRTTHFPLSDKDYTCTSSNEQVQEPFDICSTSFLEKFGLPSNHYKSTPKIRKTPESATVNYYSQLLSQPIQAQKNKPTPKRGDNGTENTKNKAPETEIKQDFFQRDLNYSQVGPDRENIRKPIQDVTNFDQRVCGRFISQQSSSVSCPEVKYVPQMDPSRSYVPRSVPYPEKGYSHTYTRQNYENTPVFGQGRAPSFVQNPQPTPAEFIRRNYAARPYPTPYDYCCYAKVPQADQYGRNFCGGVYQNIENVPMYPNRSFAQHSAAIGLNQSQLLDNNPSYEDFQRKRQYSQYFQKNYPKTEFHHQTQPQAENERSYGNLCSLQTETPKYPEMLSLQDLSQCNAAQKSTQNTSLAQQQYFEANINEENSAGNTQRPFTAPVPQREQYFSDEIVPRRIQRRPFGTYQEEPYKDPREAFEEKPKENLCKNFNRTVSFEEKPYRVQENESLRPVQGIPPRGNNLNRPVPARGSAYPNWEGDFGYESFGCPQGSNLNRSFAIPERMPHPEGNYRYPTNRETVEAFPPNYDKDYVMNKFMFSLDQ